MIYSIDDFIREACENDLLCGTDIDKKLSERDLVKDYEKIYPIDPITESVIFESYSNPESIVIINDNDNFYIEYAQLYKFMESAFILDEAAALNEIIKYYNESCGITKDNIHIILPSDKKFDKVCIEEKACIAHKIQNLKNKGIRLVKEYHGLSDKDIKDNVIYDEPECPGNDTFRGNTSPVNTVKDPEEINKLIRILVNKYVKGTDRNKMINFLTTSDEVSDDTKNLLAKIMDDELRGINYNSKKLKAIIGRIKIGESKIIGVYNNNGGKNCNDYDEMIGCMMLAIKSFIPPKYK